MLSTVKLKILMAPGQCAAWIFFAKVRKREGVGKINLRSLHVQCSWSMCLIFLKPFPVIGPELDNSLIPVTVSEVLYFYQHDIIFIKLLERIIPLPPLSLNFPIST